jgi:hypothetical protein
LFPHLQIYISSVFNFGEEENCHMGLCLGIIGLTRLIYGAWRKATAQVGPIALVHCHDEFAIYQTASILVIYGKLHHGDVIVLLNKYVGVQFSFADHI